jgi:hypothetical protein
MNNRNKIDDLFREAMTGYREQPTLGLWLRIERRFFPPSKFRPSGLITSILLLTVAGLMPWVLIPANDQNEKQPPIPEGNVKRGYLIESVAPAEIHPGDKSSVHHSGRSFSMKPTVYIEKTVDPETDPASQLIASNNDPSDDPAIQPIINANHYNYNNPLTYEDIIYYEQEQNTSEIPDQAYQVQFLNPFRAGLLNYSAYSRNLLFNPENMFKTSFANYYEDPYVRKGEFSTGLNFNPSIVFYDPNPYNKMIGGDAVVYYKISAFSIMTGVGYSRMEDVNSYRVDYVTNDSVGYYVRVIGFVPDPRNPGQITYITREEAIYDSVPHYSIEDKTNYYSYIDIPLSFGYTFYQKNKVSLMVDAGIKFSFLIASDEPTVDFWVPDAELIEIDRQVPARLNTNWRFTAGLDFGYLFTTKFSLHIEPVFEQYISPIYAKQPGYKPGKPYVTGIKAGVRYNF